jgi:hypothetical protein
VGRGKCGIVVPGKTAGGILDEMERLEFLINVY